MGAGFSAPAGLPTQNRLLDNIADPENEKELEHIKRIFAVDGSDDMSKVALEDVFTFLDKIIAGNEYAAGSDPDSAGFDTASAYNAKRDLVNYIIGALNEKLKNLRNEGAYERFFAGIAKRKIDDNETNTIVTFNWDTIPDFYINRAFEHLGRNNGVDYGVYDWTYEEGDDDYVPSILRKPQEYKTVKVLKLHGSINWMHSKKNGALYVKEQTGRYPEGVPITEKNSKEYEHIFMTPTFTKDFSTLTAKSVWFNAGLDLIDAERVVFVGCSLPLADYEFRYLLLKTAVRNKKNKIRVTLRPVASKSEQEKTKETRERFESLFIGNDIKFEEVDTADFLTDSGLIWRW
jgi:hypothetical protein